MRGCVTIHLLIIILSKFLFHLWAASPSISATSTLCHQHEKNALLNFSRVFNFNNFTPSSEYNGSLWIPGTDCCLWQGVTCNPSTGHVLALNLINNHVHSVGIEGELPSKLNSSALSRLSIINLSGNNLKGTIPTWLFEFPALVNLDLSLNLFTTIGQTNNLPISPLDHFDISFNNIEGPIPSIIFKLKSLKLLDLSSNLLSFTIPFTKLLHHFPNVIYLDLSLNHFDLNEVDNANNTDHVTSSHPQFEILRLSHCNLTKFPSLLKGQQNLWLLDLSYNNIGGEVPTFIFEIKTLLNLFLGWNYLTGIIPLSKIHLNLKHLDISRNNMSLVDDIMNNTTKTTGVTSSSYSHQFQYLYMSSCNLDQFPNVLRGQRSLEVLDLSNNNLYEDVPTWLLEANKDSLHILNISSNHLGGQLHLPLTSHSRNLYANNTSKVQDYEIIPSSICNLSSLSHLDLSHNHFTGNLPECLVYAIGNHNLSKVQDDGIIPSTTCNLSSLAYLDLSYNHITGNLPECLVNAVGHHNLSKVRDNGIIPSSNCNSSSLYYLDLSYNHFTGNLPECLANVVGNHNLSYLNLEHNQLSGTISPTLFKDCSRLKFLFLDNNNLIGKIPWSLASCSELLSLDLGNNQLADVFPMWLGTLPKLQILSLRSNKLYGSLLPNTDQNLFPQLQFLDISSNNLNGTFPESFVWSLRGMTPESKIFDPTYFTEMIHDPMFIYGSIRAMVKGIEQHLENTVLSSTVLLHASQNQFQGHIPEAIGSLVALTSLNLSHNCFTGHIPSSLSNLSQLQNLDLSSNRLDGKIPDQLRELHFLEVFNVSNNNLTGAVPQGNQFNTFDDKSYLGNPRLCGEYLTNKCRKPKRSVPFIDEEENAESANPMGWLLVETVLLGLGCGIMIGLVGGYFLFLKWIPQWILRLACPLVESILDNRWKWKNKRRI